ncbi:MAG: DNA translocase FtsK, partial [Spartobacteria bacterium]|nr:DNA translocase FtsK [Spartobacteria bacterium]
PAEVPHPLPSGSTQYQLPPLNILDDLPPLAERQIKADVQGGARILQETLAEFGIEAQVTNVEVGPVVTSYEVLPAPGVRVERIANLSNNIALSMKAVSVRVQAPIPGKGVVGIEVPNLKSTMVFLRELIESEEWVGSKAPLPLAVGKDVGGRDIVADLAKMPHMLIAGATGSGKSVCMNSLLAGLLMSCTPDQLRLMLVDPKMVEFSFFNDLPHLVVPVITDPKKVSLGLRWAINEMEKRYKLFARIGVRNIQSYNTRPIARQADLFEGELEPPKDDKQPPDRLPYIVIVIDELADLMMVAQADIENAIARLAQLSRAVGIHMIIATQRPSVNVITGTIKANFPARIAFQVAQKVDSRTILDGNGADKLLGRGDMLFLPPGTSKMLRSQGTMTSDQEIRDIVEFWKAQGQPQYELAIKDKIESTKTELPETEGDDDMFDAAVEVIRQTRRASTSSLQRRLRIGYNRAGRLMDLLEERGIVGPPNGSDPRDILIDLDGEIPSNEMEEDDD